MILGIAFNHGANYLIHLFYVTKLQSNLWDTQTPGSFLGGGHIVAPVGGPHTWTPQGEVQELLSSVHRPCPQGRFSMLIPPVWPLQCSAVPLEFFH